MELLPTLWAQATVKGGDMGGMAIVQALVVGFCLAALAGIIAYAIEEVKQQRDLARRMRAADIQRKQQEEARIARVLIKGEAEAWHKNNS
jgi:ABC-type transport system involved in cytochrome bd biosynthesis fused ATPase/permease subunit